MWRFGDNLRVGRRHFHVLCQDLHPYLELDLAHEMYCYDVLLPHTNSFFFANDFLLLVATCLLTVVCVLFEFMVLSMECLMW